MAEEAPKNPRQAVVVAFDSVSLIEAIIAGTALQDESTQTKVETVERNVSHLDIMISKEWFIAECIGTEEADINSAITDGNAYIAANQA